MKPKKLLKDLNLLDRFLFAEAMEDPDNLRILLEIILGREIVLKYQPQAEKERRNSPMYRFVRLDVFAEDMERTVYDTEVQKQNTRNLPKRSRFYQGVVDGKLLEPGEIDFNKLNDVYIITIAPFDIFGMDKYMYTFRMTCEEVPGLWLEDGAVRIFLNTHGKNPDEVSPELVELLNYIENSNEQTANGCKSQRIHELQERIEAIKSSEEVSVKYMQEWEERELEKRDARDEGHREGHLQGREEGIKALILDNLEENKNREQIIGKLVRRFSLSEEDAVKYCEKYAGMVVREEGD
ncbi:Rpn family recombination-promoting nuclease/putative transposase [Blautia schinkii]|nr:Rpn family recombination-promoting nuclease/putative transposase [Blautia schinkii]